MLFDILQDMSGFASRLWDGLDPGLVLGALVLVGFGVLFDLEPTAIALLLGIVAGVPLVRAVVDAAEREAIPGIAAIAFGGVVVAAGGYSARNGDPWLGPVLGLVSVWLVLDGVASVYAGEPAETDDELSSGEFARLHDANRVLVDELRAADRPLTAAELESRTDLSADDVERLLELHGDTGPIERVAGGYAIDEDERGLVGFARYLGRTVGGRLLRPVRLLWSGH